MEKTEEESKLDAKPATEIELSTNEKEMIKAVTSLDYAYFEDLSGLEYNINFRISPDGINLLLLASSIGDIPMIQMMVANKHVRLNHKDANGENAIFYATASGNLEAVKELRKRGCHMQISKITGAHPAHLACKKGYLDIVKYFISDIGLNPNITKKGMTMLMIASWKKHPEITKFLLENEADPNLALENGTTALYLAAKSGDHISLDYLLQSSTEVDCLCDNSKSTPLMTAVHNGNLECVKKLLIHKANVNICNSNGEDIYILASQCQSLEVFRLILTLYTSKGFELDKECHLDKMTMFMRACFTQNHKIAKYLKKKGAKINFHNSDGDSILHIALRHKLKKVIAFCLLMGCNTKLTNEKGESYEKFLKSEDPEYSFLEGLKAKVQEKLNNHKKDKFSRKKATGKNKKPEDGKLGRDHEDTLEGQAKLEPLDLSFNNDTDEG
ncbi:unnamed protein product [Moneuplotes crassus]|uniref:Ankyrin repeat protein n=1 Tax=Euplotes crassus TaxID=5936 RepID=A0AAD1UGN7_EUPCR|nr:unnamed protein product [Moneuplotes crassus]